MPHTAPGLKVNGTTRSGAAEAINTEPQKIAEGIFIGEGRAKSGEKVFLKMEVITETNKPLWETYLEATKQLTLLDRSALTYAMRYTQKVCDPSGGVRFVNENYEDLVDRLGYSKQEFDAFISLLGARGFFWAPENKARIKSVNNTHTGAAHLLLAADNKHYVIYASKTADFKMPRVDKNNASTEPLTFKEYTDLYGDLLICVGAGFPDSASVHSKGMFRNPYSTIEKTHQGLSMIIRGFSGAVVQKFFPEKTTLNCKPIPSMQYMISSSLQPDDYEVSGYSHEQILSLATDYMRGVDDFYAAYNSIKISALDRLYRNHAST